MAEIHVQAKKGGSSAWLWILISIIVIAALAFVLIWNNRDNTQNVNSKPNQTSYIQYHSLPAA
jgi:lipopolysaccharide export system protein LptC